MLSAQAALAAGQIQTGAPDLAAAEAAIAAAPPTGCNNTVLPTGPMKRYQTTYLYALTEYNTGTCAPNGPGSWSLNSQQQCDGENCGNVTFGVLKNLPLGNGDCPGHRYNFGLICYKWVKHDNIKITDSVNATWDAPTLSDPTLTFPIKVPIVYPTSETTKAKGWDPEGLGLWSQMLKNDSDPDFDWSLNSVRETNPGGGNSANDTCWCAGSAFDPFWKITGGKWFPEDTGVWEFDDVGWCTAHGPDFCPGGASVPLPVQYYRQKQRAPCGTTFPQQMQFQATNVSKAWKDYGDVNTLGGSFTFSAVTSTRAGEKQTHPFSPKPAKPRVACAAFVGSPQTAAAAATFGDSITVNDPRPVAAAIEEIVRVSGKAITYEDPPVLHRQQMVPMVRGATDDDSLLIPKGGQLRLTLPADASAGQANAAAQAVVGDYNASRGAATFTVLPDALTHVVPRQAANASGRLVPVTPVLDSKITLEAKPRSALALIAEICKAVSAASGQQVGLGTIPANQLRQQVDFGASNEPARKVLEKVIVASGATGAPLSWRLLYDPGMKSYFLNIPVIE
jgi:hypothetical protein